MRKTNVQLRIALWRARLTITAAAQAVGMRRERLSLILNGHVSAKARERRKIAKFLRMPEPKLFGPLRRRGLESKSR